MGNDVYSAGQSQVSCVSEYERQRTPLAEGSFKSLNPQVFRALGTWGPPSSRFTGSRN
jgi:hypothetical protein